MARFLAAVLAAALLVLGLAACGGKDDDGGTTGRASQDAQPVQATGIPELVERLQPSVVAVLVRSARGQGSGSGVVWDDEGRVITNDHVVDGARQVRIRTAGGTAFDAEVEATDPRTDLAVLRVDGGDLPPATFAERLPRVGSLALALGSPLGFENTVTAGIVSGLDRALPTGGAQPALVGLLQTDAAISPGNSGGALVGAGGEVIGVNVAYLPPQQTGAVSIGFAIPSPIVRDIVTQLIEDGTVDHAYLGVQLTPAPRGGPAGVTVAGAEPGGPADEAGLRMGDAITRVGDDEVRIIEDVYEALRSLKPGDTVPVTVRRGDEERTVEVQVGERPAPPSGVLPR